MANTIPISRSQLIFAICLPLAVLIGYVLAEPMESPSVAVIFLVVAVLSVPLLMKWHHPMLVICWNLMLDPAFLPGRPQLWMVMSAVSLFFTLLNRAVANNHQFNFSPSLTRALLFFTLVVVVTAALTGGVGFNVFGNSQYGGRKYAYLVAGIIGFFALSAPRIPPERAGMYVAMFFLSGLTGAVSDLAVLAGPKFYFLLDYFPAELGENQAETAGQLGISIVRYTGLAISVPAIYSYLLARYGVRGVLDWRHPWRLLLLLAALYVGMLGGFRSTIILFVLVFGAVFVLEGLHRTWYVGVVIAFAALIGTLTVANLSRLPLSVQRTLSFLPINVDPVVRQSATVSSEWRVELWKIVLPDVPKYLLKGKGYNIDPGDLFMANDAAERGWGNTEVAILAGDYHSGPLSVIIPFGFFGAIGFLWFLFAALRVMYYNYLHGNPDLRRVNAFLLASFIGKLVFFFAVFGSLFSDLALFTGLAGLSVSLNGDQWGCRKLRETVVTSPHSWHTGMRLRQAD